MEGTLGPCPGGNGDDPRGDTFLSPNPQGVHVRGPEPGTHWVTPCLGSHEERRFARRSRLQTPRTRSREVRTCGGGVVPGGVLCPTYWFPYQAQGSKGHGKGVPVRTRPGPNLSGVRRFCRPTCDDEEQTGVCRRRGDPEGAINSRSG